MHVQVVPFALVCVNVCVYPLGMSQIEEVSNYIFL